VNEGMRIRISAEGTHHMAQTFVTCGLLAFNTVILNSCFITFTVQQIVLEQAK
jgi:hypothetical protein